MCVCARAVSAAAGPTFSLPPAQVPIGPKMLWNRAILIGVPWGVVVSGEW